MREFAGSDLVISVYNNPFQKITACFSFLKIHKRGYGVCFVWPLWHAEKLACSFIIKLKTGN